MAPRIQRTGSWRPAHATSRVTSTSSVAAGVRTFSLSFSRPRVSTIAGHSCRWPPPGAIAPAGHDKPTGRLDAMSILTKVLRAGEGKKQKALHTLVPDINAFEPE